MSREITNNISLVQSSLGLLRSKVMRVKDLNSSERNQIVKPLAAMEERSVHLNKLLDEFQDSRKGGGK